ncbi:hypothetical protein VPH35_117583 [Triticum aestivum]
MLLWSVVGGRRCCYGASPGRQCCIGASLTLLWTVIEAAGVAMEHCRGSPVLLWSVFGSAGVAMERRRCAVLPHRRATGAVLKHRWDHVVLHMGYDGWAVAGAEVVRRGTEEPSPEFQAMAE